MKKACKSTPHNLPFPPSDLRPRAVFIKRGGNSFALAVGVTEVDVFHADLHIREKAHRVSRAARFDQHMVFGQVDIDNEGIEYARKNAVRLIERGRTKVVYILDSNKVLTGRVYKDGKTLFYKDYKKAIVREIRKNGSTVPYR